MEKMGVSGWPPAVRARLIRGIREGNGSRLYEDRHAIWIDPTALLRNTSLINASSIDTQKAIWAKDFGEIEQMMLYDTQTYLPGDILAKVDRASMANSLETRAPLLDHRVFESAWRLPLAAKLGPSGGKTVLRDVLERHVPKHLFDRPKQGFAVPIASWLRYELKGWGEEMVRYAGTQASPLRQEPLLRVWRAHQDGTFDHSTRLWSAFVLLQWFQKHQ
jgi:asparagine synthase (glutamine-hydrolysing)